MKKLLPNALTVLRFLLVPVFLYFLYMSPSANGALISLILFVIASLTDYVDGTLARKWNVVSDFGKIMDPLADKLLVLSALSALCWMPPFHFSKAIFFIIAMRELGITILREYYQKKGIVVAADRLGKLKTVMQMLGIIVALAAWAFLPEISAGLYMGLNIWFWLVVVITVFSGLNYLKAMFK